MSKMGTLYDRVVQSREQHLKFLREARRQWEILSEDGRKAAKGELIMRNMSYNFGIVILFTDLLNDREKFQYRINLPHGEWHKSIKTLIEEGKL